MVYEPPPVPEPGAWPPPPAVPAVELEAPPPAPPRRRWRWVLALVVAIAGAGAATIVASSSHTPKSPLAVLTAASGHTRAAGTARVDSVETISANGVSVEMHMNGANDYAHRKSEITISALGRDFETARVVAGVTYVSAPGVALPGAAHWVSLRPSDIGVSAGQSALGSNDPNSGLQYLSAVKSNPREVGSASIDGVATTHYAFTVDIKSLMDQMSRVTSKLGAPSIGGGALDGLLDFSHIPAEAWIDHDGRVRQFRMTIAVSALGESVKAVTTTKFSHFDEPLTIAVPASSDTVPFSQFPQFFSQLQANAASGGLAA